MQKALLTALFALAPLALAAEARAAIVPVADADALLAAIAAAAPGDEIVLADGTYDLTGASCTADGTETDPIIVRSENPLGAVIRLDSLEGFKVSGAHWHFESLDIQGVCADDSACEHAFHVTGGAVGFVLRTSRVRDFNAQLKANASQGPGGTWLIPHGGLIEGNELRDTAPRDTSAPVTKLNIDTGDDWIVRANVIADFHKNGGNEISYGAFMKSGGNRGLFERNLVMCSDQVQTGGVRIGLSFGGGGTGAQYCAPAFDPDVPCDPEHTDGIMRNNVIVNCSDVGIYLNLARDTRILNNTLIATTGIDFRFASSTGEADGNLLGGTIKDRNGGTHVSGTNVENITLETFVAAYQAPLAGDLRVIGDVDAWTFGGSSREDVPDDYCARERPEGPTTLGALEHSLGDCETNPPPLGETSGAGGGGDGGAASGGGTDPGAGGSSADGGGPSGSGGDAASPASGPGSTSPSATGTGGGSAGDGAASDDGCGCHLVGAEGAPAPRGAWLALFAAAAVGALRVRRPSRCRP